MRRDITRHRRVVIKCEGPDKYGWVISYTQHAFIGKGKLRHHVKELPNNRRAFLVLFDNWITQYIEEENIEDIKEEEEEDTTYMGEDK
jgi:hypothetical protein